MKFTISNSMRRLFRAVLFLFCIVVLIGMSIQLAYSTREHFGKRKFQAKVAELEKAGYPVDDATLEAAYVARTDDTHTQEWLSIFEELKGAERIPQSEGVYLLEPRSVHERFVASGPWKYDEPNRIYLEHFRDLIDRSRELAKVSERVYFPKQFNSISTEMEELNQIRVLTRLLRLDAYMCIRENKSQQLLDDIFAIFNLAKAFESEIGIIGSLVCVAMNTTALESIGIALKAGVFNQAQLQAVQARLLEEANHTPEWHQSIRDERAIYIPAFHNPAIVMSKEQNRNKVMPTRGWDGVKYLELMESADSVDSDNFEELLARGTEVEDEVEQSHRGYLSRFDYILTGLTFPATKQMARALVTRENRVRHATYAVACSAYMLEHGRAPLTLEELSLPHDRLKLSGGKPPGYRVMPDGSAEIWYFDLDVDQVTPTTPPGPKYPDSPAPEPLVWEIPLHDHTTSP